MDVRSVGAVVCRQGGSGRLLSALLAIPGRESAGSGVNPALFATDAVGSLSEVSIVPAILGS
jgi:hypothetical protein